MDFGREKGVFPLVLIQVKSAAKRTVFGLKNKREKAFYRSKRNSFTFRLFGVLHQSDTVNDTATRLITLIKAHPEYTYDEYAKALNMGRATVARHIKKLNGTKIKRIGSDKDGHWEFIKGQ